MCVCVSHAIMSNSLPPHGLYLPGSSVHGILQARILEWVAITFSRGSSRPRDWTQVSHIAGRLFTIWTNREALKLPFDSSKKNSPNPLSFRRTLSPSEGSRWQLCSIFTAPQTEHIPADNSEYSVSSQLWQGCSDGPPPKPQWPLLLSCPWGFWLPTSHIKVLMWFRLEAECRWFPGKKTEHATDDSATQGHEVKGSISQEVWWSLHLLDPLAKKERWQGTLFPLWPKDGARRLCWTKGIFPPSPNLSHLTVPIAQLSPKNSSWL